MSYGYRWKRPLGTRYQYLVLRVREKKYVTELITLLDVPDARLRIPFILDKRMRVIGRFYSHLQGSLTCDYLPKNRRFNLIEGTPKRKPVRKRRPRTS